MERPWHRNCGLGICPYPICRICSSRCTVRPGRRCLKMLQPAQIRYLPRTLVQSSWPAHRHTTLEPFLIQFQSLLGNNRDPSDEVIDSSPKLTSSPQCNKPRGGLKQQTEGLCGKGEGVHARSVIYHNPKARTRGQN